MAEIPSVLIVDDDPTHLQVYGWIVEAAGYRAMAAQVRFAGVDLPEGPADLVLLDDHLASRKTRAIDVANLLRTRLPGVPIIVLSDAMSLPEDIARLVQGFVRKGDPAKLVFRLRQLLPFSP